MRQKQHSILQQMCNIRNDCVGYTLHPTKGIILYNNDAFPLQYVRNWMFYLNLVQWVCELLGVGWGCL